MNNELQSWFLQNRRDFPWRTNPTPYAVWISEVMLQQTQASRVIDYFLRWMQRYPNVEELAKSPIEEVLKMWEGLGYYSRARSLHQAAKEICERFNGKIPDDSEKLSSIKGLGPYTVGAVLSFGFQKRHPAVDGNVMRVLTRYFAIGDDITKAKTVRSLRELTLSLLPETNAHVLSEALIELGATVCRPKPSCERCPLALSCKSYTQATTHVYPVKSTKVQYESLYREVALIFCGDKFLVRPGKEGIACTGLYEFPYFETTENGLSFREVQKLVQSELKLQATFDSYLDDERQSFTRFRVTLFPKRFTVKEMHSVSGHVWCTKEEAAALTFSSGHKRLLAKI